MAWPTAEPVDLLPIVPDPPRPAPAVDMAVTVNLLRELAAAVAAASGYAVASRPTLIVALLEACRTLAVAVKPLPLQLTHELRTPLHP